MTDSPPVPALKAFLEDPARPAGTMSYHELQGFLFAVASAPDLVPPSEWMPVVFDEHEPVYADMDEAQAVLGGLMELYNAVNASVLARGTVLPADCRFRDDTLSNLAEDAPISRWSRGFVRGHTWLEESWEGVVPEDLDEEFGATLLTLSFFASRQLADALVAETGSPDLDRLAETTREVFPDAAVSYAHLGRLIHQVRMTAEGSGDIPRRANAVGRNDPCPCGSGRKYKKCCGR